MDTEDMVRGALREEAALVAVADWSAAPVRDHVHRQRRRRRVAVGASAVVAALTVLAGTGAVLSGQQEVRTSAAARPPLLPDGPAPEAVVVEPGRQLPLDRPGWWMRLADREVCIHDEPAYKSDPGCGGYTWAGDATEITMQYYGNPPQYREGLYNLVYHGPGKVARMAMERDGKSYWATVASLPGDPGFAAGYVWGPSQKSSDGPAAYPLDGIRLAAYDAQGRVLASKTLSP
ncbi:hypothetical protein ACFRAR_17790 [Kitasatospora sp. NPDC056651]|uniref:hypothetical protein n=1 Tax=Kitasatospora sp. NPDC056651 TaxID=3345892 RepID=UPI0036BF15CE